MKDIAIYGAGGFGKEVACLIKRVNNKAPQWNLIGFFDDGKEINTEISHYGKVLGGINELNKWGEKIAIVIAIGNPNIIKTIVDNIDNNNVYFPNICDPSLYIVDTLTFNIGEGNIIQGYCNFSCDVSIGSFNIFNGDINIGHDVTIGNYNSIMPGVRISGEVKIGNANFFGINSIVLQQIKIGNNIRLGAGSVLMTKPKDGFLYIGNPAKKFDI